METTERNQLLTRYRAHAARFDAIAAKRTRFDLVAVSRARTNATAATQVRFDPIPASPDGAPPIVLTRKWPDDLISKPTDRELEVLQHISEGMRNRDIATQLFVTEETVKSHVRQILAKTHTLSRAHAVGVGLRSNYIT